MRGFSRLTVEDTEVSGLPIEAAARVWTTLPAGSRAWLLFAEANRDERHYETPDTFDLDRNSRDQVGWGHGVHLCVGKHLAQLEMESIIGALLERVERIEVDKPTRLANNTVQGYAQLPIRLIPRV